MRQHLNTTQLRICGAFTVCKDSLWCVRCVINPNALNVAQISAEWTLFPVCFTGLCGTEISSDRMIHTDNKIWGQLSPKTSVWNRIWHQRWGQRKERSRTCRATSLTHYVHSQCPRGRVAPRQHSECNQSQQDTIVFNLSLLCVKQTLYWPWWTEFGTESMTNVLNWTTALNSGTLYQRTEVRKNLEEQLEVLWLL